MPLKVAALYQFAALPDFRQLREPLRALAAGLGIKGSVLLAHEGINGTVAGGDEAIDAFVGELQHGPLFGGRLDNLELKFSSTSEMPFQGLKVRLKKEIVTLGDTAVDPTRQVGTYVEPSDWNELIAAPDTLVIDIGAAPEGSDKRAATVWLALAKDKETVSITRGENRGKEITYHHPVRELSPVGMWKGEAMTIRLPLKDLKAKGGDQLFALLQVENSGPIIGVAAHERR